MENQFKNKYFKYKNKYIKLKELIGGGGKILPPPKEPGYYYYINNNDQNKHLDKNVKGRWVKDADGTELINECFVKRNRILMKHYGVKNKANFIIHYNKPQSVVEEKYGKINGVIQQETLNKIIFDNIPDNFNKPELKSAMVWGALNRANSINGIQEVLRLRYITQNEKMKIGNPNTDSCQFVKYYVKLSEDNTWVQNTKKTLGL